MIHLDAHPEGVLLLVRAHAAARRNEIKGEGAGSLQVSVTQAPEKGKANKAIIAQLATTLGLRKSQIELVSGESSPTKRFLVRDIAATELLTRIRGVLAPPSPERD